MHFNDFIDFQDKMNHLFLRALGEGIYSQAVKEVKESYKEKGIQAINTFESDYASLIKRFV